MTDLQSLSDRELEILELVATGKSNKDIARELHITTNTVKVHVRNIFGKLEVASRTEASMVAMRAGLIGSNAVEEIASPAPAPETAPAPVARQNAQTWILAGILVSVTLLIVIAYRLFNPAPESQATAPADSFAFESQWQDAPNLPEPRTRAAAVALENAVYVIGGLIGEAPSASVASLDPEIGEWTTLAPKPTAVSEIQAAVLGGLVYVPGGRLASGAASSRLEIYNPRLDAWETGPDLPSALSAYALTAHEGKLYLFGGHDGTGFTDRAFSYDPDNGAWSELTPLPSALGYAGAAVVGSRIYVIGGFDGRTVADATLVYSPALEGTDSPWETAAAMPEGRYGMSLISIADKIHLIGGLGGRGEFFSQMDYVPQSNLWQVIENPLGGEWAYPAAAALGTEIFVLGGELDGSPTDRSLAYQVLFIVVIPMVPGR
jgi:DNA-binding CsgD family transcriptional regulator/N-acetylneuraminic acid mutarotase